MKVSKKWLVVLVVAVIVVAGYFIAKNSRIDDRGGGQGEQVCIQVITPARNPQTGEIKNFPTPCDVPEGWEKLEPETTDNTLRR